MSDDKGQVLRREELARELAERLGDPEGYRNYLKLARQYSELFLRSVLSQVLEIPAEKIRKNRGALFTWLVLHDGKNAENREAPEDTRD